MGQQITNLKLAAALELAARCRQQPELLIDGPAARENMIALADAVEASKCYRNAQLKGREVFVLQSDDKIAPTCIDLWADEAKAAGVTPEKVADAYEVAKRWRINPDARTPD